MKEGWRAEQKINVLLGMIEDDGASPSGSLPPSEYRQALRTAPVGRANEVREAHRKNRQPSWAGNQGGPNG
ncbi:MAG: hypothetical protein ABEH58_00780 [Haloplanus sp.]